ncbi:ATP-dependent DNA helicase PcrA [Sorangium cellulosum]|uniref:DNA 3'-5' helicase n=1 Tax=Sorangium cellulosum TaxID=56 RepID=A0A2L0EKJ1_SORCE|nr:UvrD-helicase domain-containing protein [Sorangium cellulosum]AUX39817.1 ATP-dependent DNA helicase PcrA [Sorangium cellulosum]
MDRFASPDRGAFPPPEPGIPYEELNEPQARAASHADGPLLIFAGAGSGKTRVIVYRIANLIVSHRVPPYRILAVTFTNKAASEMKRRLEGLIGADIVKDLWVGTFHAVCARLLRRHHEAAGLERSFVIYDDDDQRAVMNRVLKELNLDERRYPPRQVLSRIHAEKQEGRGPADFERKGYFDDAIARCFAAYERHLKAANAVDFDDLLLAVLRLAEDPESLAGEDLRNRFRHVLVDEFQDVNQVQYRLVRAFCRSHDNLCVVGDDDQSIYRWRGADVRIVRGFRRDFPRAEVVKLEQNYRSAGHIVRGALGVIRTATDREPKELWTANPDGAPIDVVCADSEHDEAAWVVECIRELIGRGVSPSEIAVFYRIHAQSRVLEEVLREARIPYQIIGGTRFFERAEVKNLLSYLRVVVNPRSDVDLNRIINVPARKIGQSTVDKLIQAADALGVSLYEAIEPLAEGRVPPSAMPGGQLPPLAPAARRSLLGFRELIQGLMASARTMAPSDLAQEVLAQSGYARMLEADDSVEAEARLQNLRELVQSIVDYEQEAFAAGDEATLAGYLERVSLVSDVDALADAPKVAMMTVHAAKGLEFHSVFLTGMEEDLFPFRSQDPGRKGDIEEERRLAYVALTRARDRLWITHAARRAIFGQTRYGLPSRFLADLPAASVRPIATPTSQMAQRRVDFGGGGSTSFGARSGGVGEPRSWEGRDRRPAGQVEERLAWSRLSREGEPARGAPAGGAREVERAPGERYVEREAGGDGGEGLALRRGMRVIHERFGPGVVESVDPGADPIATVKFSGWGKKRIKAAFLRAAS